MNLNECPSASEFDGFYNVQVDIADSECSYLNTFSDLPSLTLEEINQVSQSAYEIIFRYANQWWFTADETRRYYESCISKQLEDRTLNMSFINVDDCTSELVKQLQCWLSTDYPLWRIRIGGSSHETTILIYPDIVRYGSLPIEIDQTESFARVMQKEKLLRGAVGDMLQIQRVDIQRAIQAAIAAGLGARVVFPIAFDHYNGDSSKTAVWSICSRDTPDLDLLEQPKVMAGYRFYVKFDGDFGYHVSDDSPFWIREWIFPKNQLPSRLKFTAYDLSYQPETITVDLQPLKVVRQQGE